MNENYIFSSRMRQAAKNWVKEKLEFLSLNEEGLKNHFKKFINFYMFDQLVLYMGKNPDD